MTTLTKEYVLSVLDYDQSTGEFRRKSKALPPGQWKVERSVNGGGYIRICVLGKYRLAHRLAWICVYGVEPSTNLDHINRNKKDNRIANLREVTRSENNQNTWLSKANTSGIRGVTWNAKLNKWQAAIGSAGKLIYLGCFASINDAKSAYETAAASIHRYNPFAAMVLPCAEHQK